MPNSSIPTAEQVTTISDTYTETKPQEEPNSNEQRETIKTDVESEWFKAYLEGNGYLPQHGFGILIFLGDSLLNNTDTNWEEFYSSQLSEDQIIYVGKLMTSMHRTHNVAYADRLNAKLEDKVVKPEDFKELWGRTTEMMLSVLNNSLRIDPSYTPATLDETNNFNLDIARALNEEYRDPRNKSLFEKLRNEFTELKKILLEPELKALAREHKKLVVQDSKQNTRYHWASLLIAEARARLLEKSNGEKPILDNVLASV
jgi:hypothetical protein